MAIALTALIVFIIFLSLMRIAYLVIMDDSKPSEKKQILTLKSFFNL